MDSNDCFVPGTMAHAKRQALVAALVAADYNVHRAATLLRIGRSTLYRMIEQFGVEVKPGANVLTMRGANDPSTAIPGPTGNIRSILRYERGEYVLHRLAPDAVYSRGGVS